MKEYNFTEVAQELKMQASYQLPAMQERRQPELKDISADAIKRESQIQKLAELERKEEELERRKSNLIKKLGAHAHKQPETITSKGPFINEYQKGEQANNCAVGEESEIENE